MIGAAGPNPAGLPFVQGDVPGEVVRRTVIAVVDLNRQG